MKLKDFKAYFLYFDERFSRPTMATWDKNTILLAASEVKEGDSPLSNPLTEQWLYKFGEGWTSLGPIGNSEL